MRKDQSEVSCCVKYLLFFFNVFFWLIGGLTVAIGLYARFEKTAYQDFFNDIVMDPAFALIIVGGIMFILGFTGCIGALRENVCLLKFFSVILAIIFFLQLSLAVVVFVFQDKVEDIVANKIRSTIVSYRDNVDLQVLIDGIQQEFQCCGGKTYDDWGDNIYFNCSSPGAEACGVPFSCCREDTINTQCGYGIRHKVHTETFRNGVIYTRGCIEAVKKWFKDNMFVIGGVAVGIALLQIIGICFANSLITDIKLQLARWHRPEYNSYYN
ncbi:tetraspanin-17-like [Acropora muricata]|uniref:tetraspanin-17-like n=1 Tax=Acropora millepora TaxID=45264 RepID=UPI0010FCB0F5|nr:tetraspanin-17-like [Acropora millepora]